MGDLTPHFSKAEFACPCCMECVVSPRLLMGCEELRDKVGRPVVIHSAYRCHEHNSTLPGAAGNSTHLTGEGADLSVPGMTQFDLYTIALTIPEFLHGGIGVYPQDGHLHVDVREKGPARWSFFDGAPHSILDGLRILQSQAQAA